MQETRKQKTTMQDTLPVQTEKILNFKLSPQIETSANIYFIFNFMYLEMYNMGITFLL